jgi:hypothetical protein
MLQVMGDEFYFQANICWVIFQCPNVAIKMSVSCLVGYPDVESKGCPSYHINNDI